eukprot:ANDGO_03589.mRNA.1 ABC transporter A family member 1
MDGVKERALQCKILIMKNYTLLWRRKFSTLLQLVFPSFTILLLFLFALGIDRTYPAIKNPPMEQLSYLYPCKEGPQGSCCKLVYGPDAPFSTDLMVSVASSLGYGSIGNVYQGSGTPSSSNINVLVGSDNMQNMYDWLLGNENRTTVAVWFNSRTSYTVFFNSTWESPYEMIQQPLMVQRGIDEAIIRNVTQTLDFQLRQGYRAFPSLEVKLQGQAIISAFYGAPFFYLSVAFSLISLMNSIVSEKEERLRFGMKIMGLKDSVYWWTWLWHVMSINFVSILMMMAFGYIFGLRFFTQSNFFVVFFMFLSFLLALTPLSFLLTIFISRARSANVVGFAAVVFGMFFILFFSNGSNGYSWYDPSGIRPIFLIIFYFFPFFNFSRIFNDITLISVQQQYDDSKGGYSSGDGYSWSDLYKTDLLKSQYSWTIPPTADSFYLLLFNFAFYYVLTWYFDNTIPSADGVAHPPYFFLLPSYWFGAKKASSNDMRRPEIMALNRAPVGETEDEDVARERQAAFTTTNETPGLRLLGLEKYFQASVFRKDPKKDVFAVRGMSLSIPQGSLTALLGHNGAGKTTTISMLVGLYPPSRGAAYVFGHSIESEIDTIRRFMGVCPQHDILWGELTGAEHLRMFAQFKKLPKERISQEVEERLRDVDLDKVGYKVPVSAYSGGMKRRLSVAISAIGDPRIIVLDEPTTGMDPASKRKVWKLIHELKKDRVVLLTTHSMEEADALSDRIAIMAFGRLRCIGDAVRLKTRFGEGYAVNLVTDEARVGLLKSRVTSLCPNMIAKSDNAGNLLFGLPFAKQAELKQLFEWIEADALEGDRKVIRDWGLSYTTLEEVYLRVTHDANFGFGADQATNSIENATRSANAGARPQTGAIYVSTASGGGYHSAS